MMSKTNYLTLLRVGVKAALVAAIIWLTYLAALGLWKIDSPFLKVAAGFFTAAAIFIIAVPTSAEFMEAWTRRERIYLTWVLASIILFIIGGTMGSFFIAGGQSTLGVVAFLVMGAGIDAIGVLNIIARCSGKPGLFIKEE